MQRTRRNRVRAAGWVVMLLAMAAGPRAEARHGYAHRVDTSSAPATAPVMVRTVGYHLRSSSKIVVWRGNRNKMSTMVHELLHRTTNHQTDEFREQIKTLTGDPKINEGLTSYFTKRALAHAGLSRQYPDPPAGASFGQLRQWARGIRADAQRAIQQTFGVEVHTKQISVLSDTCFGRCYQRDHNKPWAEQPGQPGSYNTSRSRVEQLVDLVGEQPVRQTYFQGDTAPLRAALRRVQQRGPTALPDWIQL